LEAARLLSFRAAAKSVALSPAAFGQRIRQLEDELDAKLFHRTTRTVVLTEAGLALVPHAERALDAINDCGRAARGELGPAPAELTIGTRHELGLSWIVPMLPGIRRDHPWLTLHLYFGSGRDLVAHVRSLAIDCAVTSTRLVDPMLESVRLHEERYVFVGSAKLLERQPLDAIADASEHTLVDTTEEMPLFRYWRDAPGGVDSLEFRNVLRMGTIAAIRHTVARGDGVAVLPRYYVQKDLDAGRMRIVLPKVEPRSDYFRLVFRSDDPRRGLFDTLAERMRGEPLR
jgi:DNA-binding transcriptional LysR family regulator